MVTVLLYKPVTLVLRVARLLVPEKATVSAVVFSFLGKRLRAGSPIVNGTNQRAYPPA